MVTHLATQPDDDLAPWLEASVAHVRAKKLSKAKKMTQAIVIQRDVSAPLEFTPDQQQMIRDSYANGCSEQEFKVLIEVAKLRKLNPLLKQVHFVSRWNGQLKRNVWTAQVSIDGLRAIAERTGKYDGQDEPEFELDAKGLILSCKVKVYRKDWSRPAVGIAHWSEYVQTTKEGGPTRFWQTMPRVMLAKCAEALAMRKAFPEDMGGLYVDEEMQQADNAPAPQLESANGTNGPHHAHVYEGEDAHAPPVESAEYDALLKIVRYHDALLRHDAATYDQVLGCRAEVVDTKSPWAKRWGAIADHVAPVQRKELGAAWQRLKRLVVKLEQELRPPVEASFADGPEADEFDQRQPGDE